MSTMEDEDDMLCQAPGCVDRTRAVRVCHHPQCMEEQNNRPLLLCRQCDLDIHRNTENSGHLVLDASKRRKPLGNSLPSPQTDHHSNTEGEESEPERDEDTIDGLYRKRDAIENKRTRSPSEHERKLLKRKKAVKKKSISKNDSFLGHSHSLDSGLNMANSFDQDSESREAADGLKEDIEGVTRPDDILNGDPGIPPTGRTSLTRQPSRMPSVDDYFTLKFADNPESEDIEVVAAVKNTKLREVLMPMLERRGLDLNLIDVFVAHSNTPLPINCDTFLLAGNTLHIKTCSRKKDSEPVTRSASSSRPNSASKSNSTKSAKSAGGSLRARRGTNLSIDDTYSVPSTSPQGTLTFNEGKKIKAQNKLSTLFAPLTKDREKQEQLNEILNSYSTNGLPPWPALLSFNDYFPYEESVFQLEPHWSSIVDNASSLSKRQHDQQEAIWELLQTEVSYINQLRVITDVFQKCLLNVQGESLLNEIETENLFSNIGAIMEVNRKFWDDLTKVLNETRRTRCPLNPSLLKSGFLKKFQTLFVPYVKYCTDQKACVDYLRSKCNENELFRTFVVWAEAQKQCNRLKLADLLVKPMQRLTKYSLLLQAISRKTDNDKQRLELLEMISSVDKFVQSVNTRMGEYVEMQKMEAIMVKIEPYDVVEAPNDECVKLIQCYNYNFDLMSPIPGLREHRNRSLLMHSALRLKESSQPRMDVDCFLFTDLLLICKSSKRMDKFKIMKPPMSLDRVIVHDLKDKGSFLLIYLNEYHMPISAFTFHGDTIGVRLWLEHIKEAQESYAKLKNQFNSDPQIPVPVTEEVLYTPVYPIGPQVITGIMERTDSLESTEGKCIPNLVPIPSPSETQNGGISHHNLEEVGRTESLGNILDHSPSDRLQVDRGSASSPEHSPVVDRKHKPVISCMSVPNIDVQSDISDTRMPSTSNSISNDSNLTDFLDEDTKTKLNQRRTSRTEKRYYTVDSIQELQKKDRDSSIHKRLSLNFNSKDLKLEERQLRDKTQSTDSIRSIPSSSGFSSSGSLQNPESELCEETESSLVKDGHDMSSLSIDQNDDMPTAELSQETKRNKSKSTSDIATLFMDLKASGLEEGISSVDLPRLEANKKKLSHAQILKMKKQLLLTTNVEASEV